MSILTNIKCKSNGKCAFCKNWYDPTNSAIEPQAPKSGFWKFNEKQKAKCLKTGLEQPAFATCKYYECKL